MKRFQLGAFEGINFSKAFKKSPEVKFIKVDEEFQAGTATGIQSGRAGDYVIIDNGSWKVVSAADFEANYTVTEVAKEVKKKKVEEKPVKKAAKKAPAKKVAPVKTKKGKK